MVLTAAINEIPQIEFSYVPLNEQSFSESPHSFVRDLTSLQVQLGQVGERLMTQHQLSKLRCAKSAE